MEAAGRDDADQPHHPGGVAQDRVQVGEDPLAGAAGCGTEEGPHVLAEGQGAQEDPQRGVRVLREVVQLQVQLPVLVGHNGQDAWNWAKLISLWDNEGSRKRGDTQPFKLFENKIYAISNIFLIAW